MGRETDLDLDGLALVCDLDCTWTWTGLEHLGPGPGGVRGGACTVL